MKKAGFDFVYFDGLMLQVADVRRELSVCVREYDDIRREIFDAAVRGVSASEAPYKSGRRTAASSRKETLAEARSRCVAREERLEERYRILNEEINLLLSGDKG